LAFAAMRIPSIDVRARVHRFEHAASR
jgi:hypothetical protein